MTSRPEAPFAATALEAARRTPAEAAAAWRADGGAGAWGCFPVYAPRELIWAAGLLPLDIDGAGGRIPLAHANAYLQSFVCTVARSSLELALAGGLLGLDGVVFPYTCDVARNLAGTLALAAPDLRTCLLHLPHTAHDDAVGFLARELEALRRALADFNGREVRDVDIDEAVAIYARSGALLRELRRLRTRKPALLSPALYAALIRSGGRLGPAQHQGAATAGHPVVVELRR